MTHKYSDIMIDIETFSTDNNAAVVSIGAVAFDITDARNIGPQFYVVCNDPTGTCSFDTVLWWLEQEKEARDAITKENSTPIKDALLGLKGFIETNSLPVRVWANDPSFDLVILRNACERNGIPNFLQFRCDRSVRTMRFMNEEFGRFSIMLKGINHKAITDAIAQAEYVQAVYGCLREKYPAARQMNLPAPS